MDTGPAGWGLRRILSLAAVIKQTNQKLGKKRQDQSEDRT